MLSKQQSELETSVNFWDFREHFSVVWETDDENTVFPVMFSRNDAFLWEDKEREEDGEEGEQQRNWEVDEVSRGGHKGDEARLVGGDLAVDPGLVLWYPSVDSWEIGLSAAYPKAHHSSLDPNGAVFNHQWASRVTLHTPDMVVIAPAAMWMHIWIYLHLFKSDNIIFV